MPNHPRATRSRSTARGLLAAVLLGAAPVEAAMAGGVTFHATPADHEAAVAGAGLALHGVEDFESAHVPPGTAIGIDDPLDETTTGGAFDAGDILPGVRIQSNTNGTFEDDDPGLDGLFPAGASGLVAYAPGVAGATDLGVGPAAFGWSRNSLDLIVEPATVRAMSLRVADVFPTADGPIHVFVLDRDDQVLGEVVLDGDGTAGAWIGFVLDDPADRIGRVNVWGPGAFDGSAFGGDELVYELALYGVCPSDLDADGTTGFGDLLRLLAEWGVPAAAPPDLDGDGTVAFGDVLALLSSWGPCDVP